MGQARDRVPCAVLKLVHVHSSFDAEGGEVSLSLTGDYWVTPDTREAGPAMDLKKLEL